MPQEIQHGVMARRPQQLGDARSGRGRPLPAAPPRRAPLPAEGPAEVQPQRPTGVSRIGRLSRWSWTLAGVAVLALAAWAQTPGAARAAGAYRLHWSPALFVVAPPPPWLAGGALRAWRGHGAELARAMQAAQASQKTSAAKKHKKSGAFRGQAKHIFFVIPAFEVGYIKNVPPMTPHQKFTAMIQGVYDYDGLGFSAAETALEHDSAGFCGYGHGWGGFGKCYVSALADSDDASFLGDYVFPVWFHQDPRYFVLGDGYSVWQRLWYGATRLFVARSDHGGWTFSSAALLGSVLAASASNLYYPKSDRGFGLTASRLAWDLGGTVFFNWEAEFWPDIHRIIFGQ